MCIWCKDCGATGWGLKVPSSHWGVTRPPSTTCKTKTDISLWEEIKNNIFLRENINDDVINPKPTIRQKWQSPCITQYWCIFAFFSNLLTFPRLTVIWTNKKRDRDTIYCHYFGLDWCEKRQGVAYRNFCKLTRSLGATFVQGNNVHCGFQLLKKFFVSWAEVYLVSKIWSFYLDFCTRSNYPSKICKYLTCYIFNLSNKFKV